MVGGVYLIVLFFVVRGQNKNTFNRKCFVQGFFSQRLIFLVSSSKHVTVNIISNTAFNPRRY